MGATLVRNTQVFTFQGGVIFLSERAEKNCYPHHYHWAIEFVGSEHLFTAFFVPRIAYFYNDGLTQSAVNRDGAAFARDAMAKLSCAQELTVRDLHRFDYFGYSLSAEHAVKLENADHLAPIRWLSTERFGARLETPEDIAQMVRDAAVGVSEETPWCNGLYALSSLDCQSLPAIGRVVPGAGGEAELYLDGQWLGRGDAQSIRILFKNIVGVNFKGRDCRPLRHPSVSGTHEEYLAQMQSRAFLDLALVGRLELVQQGRVQEAVDIPVPDQAWPLVYDRFTRMTTPA